MLFFLFVIFFGFGFFLTLFLSFFVHFFMLAVNKLQNIFIAVEADILIA